MTDQHRSSTNQKTREDHRWAARHLYLEDCGRRQQEGTELGATVTSQETRHQEEEWTQHHSWEGCSQRECQS